MIQQPGAKIIWNRRDITADVSAFLISVTYTDRVAGESDEIELRFDDTDGRWRDNWMPAKKDKIQVSIGDGAVLVDCGTFDIDEVEYEGPPDVLIVRGVATGISKALRTVRSSSHESKSLQQIAESVATAHGLQLAGVFENIIIARATQHRETDLAFLKRLADEYGYVFSVRDGVMTFHSIYDLEGASPSTVHSAGDLMRYSVRIKSVGTYKSTEVASRNPKSNTVVKTTFSGNSQANADGVPFAQVVADDTQVIRTKTEDAAQAKQKARAAHHRANTDEVTGDFEMPGNPLVLAGTNHEIHNLGQFGGVYHITESKHSLDRSRYVTSFKGKRVGLPTAENGARDNINPLPPAQISRS